MISRVSPPSLLLLLVVMLSMHYRVSSVASVAAANNLNDFLLLDEYEQDFLTELARDIVENAAAAGGGDGNDIEMVLERHELEFKTSENKHMFVPQRSQDDDKHRALQDGGGGNDFCNSLARALTRIATFGFWQSFTNLCPINLFGNIFNGGSGNCNQEQVSARIAFLCERIFRFYDNLRNDQELVCSGMCSTFYTVTCQGCP